MNFITVVVCGLLAIFVFFGMLFGLIRGTKKSLLRLIIVLGCAVGAYFIALNVSSLLTNVRINGQNVFEYIYMHINLYTVQWQINTLIAPELLLALPFAIVSLIVFVVSYFVLKALSSILYAILGLFARGRKGKLMGMILGAAQGFVSFTVIMIALSGGLNIFARLQTTSFNGKPLLGEMKVLNMKVDANEFNNSILGKCLMLGDFNSKIFDDITKITIQDEVIYINTEVNLIFDSMQLVSSIKDFSKDADSVEQLINTAFESKIISLSMDNILEYIENNPQKITGNADFQVMLVKAVKEARQNPEVCLKDFVNVLMISSSYIDGNFNINNFNFDKDMTELVDAIWESSVMRAILPDVAVMITKPIFDSFGIDMVATAKEVTDWGQEKQNFNDLIAGIQYINKFSQLTKDNQEIEDFFSDDNASTLGKFMDSLKESELFSDLYAGITKRDATKNSYFIIEFLNDTLVGKDANMSVFGFFTQQGAYDSSNNTIDWKKFSWTTMFKNTNDMIKILVNIKEIQNSTNGISDMSFEQISEILKSLDGNQDLALTFQNVLNTFVGDEDTFVIPTFENVDFAKEAEIYEALFDIQNAGTQTSEQAEQLVNLVAESSFILPLFTDNDSIIPIADEQVKDQISEAIENGNYTTEQYDALKKVFNLE